MQAWFEFLKNLEQSLPKELVDRWLRSLKLISFDACNIYLEAKNSLQIHFFEEHIRPLTKEWKNANNRPIRIHLILENTQKALLEEKKISPDSLESDALFSTFTPTPSTLLSLKLLQNLIDPPFNPIFLYGPTGCGKTHLLMAAAAHHQNHNVFYVRADTFTKHVVDAIRTGQMEPFRKIYRELDILIIDDIHLLAKKNATQEEFFHTFNTLHTKGKTILLSANAPPNKLEQIEPRLISRFEWGIALPLLSPTREELLCLTQNKAKALGLTLEKESFDLLLNFQNMKKISRALFLLLRREGKDAKKLLNDLLLEDKKESITPEQIIKTVANHFGIKSEDLLGKSQTKECSFPRQLSIYLLRTKLNLSLLRIADIFDRDHSTILSSIRSIEKKSKEAECASLVTELLRKID